MSVESIFWRLKLAPSDFMTWFNCKKVSDNDFAKDCDKYEKFFEECWETAQESLREQDDFDENAFDDIDELKSRIQDILDEY